MMWEVLRTCSTFFFIYIFQPCLAAHFHDIRRNNQQQDAVCASCGQTEHHRLSNQNVSRALFEEKWLMIRHLIWVF
ncbi:uncharacterized protein BYT42DRAFT_557140, partial [Radiomyces spectabilis]|uniref:uncharacterized protein n=1 Tax=Radiomyces spectabilis TaxID=64574 RepID=UPI00221F7610